MLRKSAYVYHFRPGSPVAMALFGFWAIKSGSGFFILLIHSI